jgi:hypothetical protein
MTTPTSKDPQWDRVIEIAAKLWVEGLYVTELDPSPTQRFVDLQWAARQAGRVLGGEAKVRIGHALAQDDPRVTVTVTYVDSTGRGLRRAEEGLEELMRMVLARQEGC